MHMLEVRRTGGNDEETATKEVNERLEWLGHLTRMPNHKINPSYRLVAPDHRSKVGCARLVGSHIAVNLCKL